MKMKKYAVIFILTFLFLSVPSVEAQNHFDQSRALFFANGDVLMFRAMLLAVLGNGDIVTREVCET